MWEEGRLPGRRVAGMSGVAAVGLVTVDTLLTDRLTLMFDLGFVSICVVAAFAVRPRDLFVVGVLPPLLMLGTFVLLAAVARGTIGDPVDGVVQAVISGLAHHAGALVTGYGLVLAVIALRQMAVRQSLPGQSGTRRAHR